MPLIREEMSPTLKEKLQNMAGEGMMLLYAVKYFFLTIYEVMFIEQTPSLLFQPFKLRERSFSRLWLALAPPKESEGVPPINPDTPFANLPALLRTAEGRTLELGPGTGTFLPFFTPQIVSTIYGAEPSNDLHPALQKAANVAKLGDKYHILHCGGEMEALIPALCRAGLLTGQVAQPIFDNIVCCRVLCSVPNLQESLETLYALLRPGGKFILCEHIINHWGSNKGSFLGRFTQILLTLCGWPFFMGGCRLDRDTVTILKKIGNKNGGWEKVDIDFISEWSALPFATGCLVKRSENYGEALGPLKTSSQMKLRSSTVE